MRKEIAVAGIMFLGLVGLARPADVTVSKPGNGGTYATVQAGIDAAGVGGTVTILDSELYIEDVTIDTPASGVTIQAAAGQRPTIRAANLVNRLAAIGVDSAADHVGLAVQAACTLIGLSIENNDLGVSTLGGQPFGSCVVFIQSPGSTLRDCRITGPGSPPQGRSNGCFVAALTDTPASATLENCEVSNADNGVLNFTLRWILPGLPDSSITMTDCLIHHTYWDGFANVAGEGVVRDCTIRDNEDKGLWVAGGRCMVSGCDIVDNKQIGLHFFWQQIENAGRTNFPQATMTDCLIARNGFSGVGWNVQIDDGSLTIDRSIIGQSAGSGGVWMGNRQYADAVLNMDFCDIYEPGKTCLEFAPPGVMGATAAITNSILVGSNGVMCNADPSMTASVSFCSAWVTGTAYQDVATSNNVTIEPLYLDPNAGTRDDFRYYNDNLNVGEGGANIGSRGQYIPEKPLRARSWPLYE